MFILKYHHLIGFAFFPVAGKQPKHIPHLVVLMVIYHGKILKDITLALNKQTFYSNIAPKRPDIKFITEAQEWKTRRSCGSKASPSPLISLGFPMDGHHSERDLRQELRGFRVELQFVPSEKNIQTFNSWVVLKMIPKNPPAKNDASKKNGPPFQTCIERFRNPTFWCIQTQSQRSTREALKLTNIDPENRPGQGNESSRHSF